MRYLKPVVAIAVLIALLLVLRMLPVAAWLESFKAWVQGQGALGYVLYALVYMVCCVFLIPALALTLGAGAIFGVLAGSLVNLVGATLGATLAFLLARGALRQRIERITSGHVKFRALDRAITQEGTKLMWLVRLSGFPPFTWVNYGFGLTGVRLAPYMLTTFFGIIPGTVLFTSAGAAGAAALTGSGNRALLILTAVGAVLVSVFIARLASKAIKKAGLEEA